MRVGTHAIAPLLATLRNSFRFTYGFGFVYDRNFGPIDAYNRRSIRGIAAGRATGLVWEPFPVTVCDVWGSLRLI